MRPLHRKGGNENRRPLDKNRGISFLKIQRKFVMRQKWPEQTTGFIRLDMFYIHWWQQHVCTHNLLFIHSCLQNPCPICTLLCLYIVHISIDVLPWNFDAAHFPQIFVQLSSSLLLPLHPSPAHSRIWHSMWFSIRTKNEILYQDGSGKLKAHLNA